MRAYRRVHKRRPSALQIVLVSLWVSASASLWTAASGCGDGLEDFYIEGLVDLAANPSGPYTSAQTVTLSVALHEEVKKAGVSYVEFLEKGGEPACTVAAPPFSCEWAITSADNGTHSWFARVHAPDGQSTRSQDLELMVAISAVRQLDPDASGLVGFLPGVDRPMDVATHDTRAFVADETYGLVVVDLSDSDAPSILGSSDKPFRGLFVDSNGTRAIVAGDSNGLLHFWVLDVSGQPEVLGEIETTLLSGNARKVSMNAAGSLAVAATMGGGLKVINLSNPAQPFIEGTFAESAFATSVDLDPTGEIAYLVDQTQDLLIVDLTDRSNPTRVGNMLHPTDTYRDIAVSNGIAFLANQNGAARMTSVANPANPVYLGGLGETPIHAASHIAAAGNFVALSGTKAIGGLRPPETITLYDASTPGSPQQLAQVELPNGHMVLGGIAFLDGRVITASGGYDYSEERYYGSGLLIHNADLSIAATITNTFKAAAVARAGDRGVAIGTHLPTGTLMLRVLDLSDPTRPRVRGDLDTGIAGLASYGDVKLTADGRMAVVAALSRGILIVDLTNPASPFVEGSYDTSGFAYGVELSSDGETAYVADGTGDLAIVDIHEAAHPALVSQLSLSGIMRDVVVHGGFAFLASQQGSAQHVDISDPQAPRWRGSLASNPGFYLDSDGTYIALLGYSGSDAELRIYDLGNPTDPPTIGVDTTHIPAAAGNGVAVANGRVYVSAGDTGVIVFDILADASLPNRLEYVETVKVVGGAYGVSADPTDSIVLVGDSAAGVSVLSL